MSGQIESADLAADLIRVKQRYAALVGGLDVGANEPNSEWAALVSSGVFHDLLLTPGCTIPETENRAITLSQLEQLDSHLVKRLSGGASWTVSRFMQGDLVKQQLSSPDEATLYDVNEHILLPCTSVRCCSFVEILAASTQKPDWFVSHW